MKKIIFFCFATALSSTWLLAQNAPEINQPDKPEARTAWVICTDIPKDLENPITLLSGKDAVQVTLSKRNPSEAIKIPTDGLIQVVKKMTTPEEPSEPSYATLAQIQIPPAINQALIILVPISKTPEGLIFETKVQDLAEFNGGEWLYVNTTKFKIRIEVGAEDIRINPSTSKIYKAIDPTKTTSLTMSYSADAPEVEKWKIISSSNIASYPNRREICIFTWDERHERIDYHGITLPAL